MTRRLVPLLAAALALAVASPAWAGDPAPKVVLHIGDQAPSFFLQVLNPDVAGTRRVVLDNWFSDGKSKAVLISFFATWCHPCKKELPVLEKLYEKYKDKGLKVVVISIDKDSKAIASLPEFIKARGLTFPVVNDRFNLLARRYLGTSSALPSLFIADATGKIIVIHQSYTANAASWLDGELRHALGLPAEAATAKAAPVKKSAGGGGGR